MPKKDTVEEPRHTEIRVVATKIIAKYSHRYPAYPTQEVAAELEHHIDIHRQAYNYTLYEYENVDADAIGSAYKHHYRLPDWKDQFSISRRHPQRWALV